MNEAYVLSVAGYDGGEHMFTDNIVYVTSEESSKRILQHFVNKMCPFEDFDNITFSYFINKKDVDRTKKQLKDNLDFIVKEIGRAALSNKHL